MMASSGNDAPEVPGRPRKSRAGLGGKPAPSLSEEGREQGPLLQPYFIGILHFVVLPMK